MTLYLDMLPNEILEMILDKTENMLDRYKLAYINGQSWADCDDIMDKSKIHNIKCRNMAVKYMIINPRFPILALLICPKNANHSVSSSGIWLYDIYKNKTITTHKNTIWINMKRDDIITICSMEWSKCGRYICMTFTGKPIICIIDIFSYKINKSHRNIAQYVIPLTSSVFARYYMGNKLGDIFTQITPRSKQNKAIESFRYSGFHNMHKYLDITSKTPIANTPQSPVMGFSLHPDKHRFVTGYDGEYIAFWSISQCISLDKNIEPICRLKIPDTNRAWIIKLEWSPCGNYLAIIRIDGTWCIWSELANTFVYLSKDNANIYIQLKPDDISASDNTITRTLYARHGCIRNDKVVDRGVSIKTKGLSVTWEPICSRYLVITAAGATPIIWDTVIGSCDRVDIGLYFEDYSTNDYGIVKDRAKPCVWFHDSQHILLTHIIGSGVNCNGSGGVVYDCKNKRLVNISNTHKTKNKSIWDNCIVNIKANASNGMLLLMGNICNPKSLHIYTITLVHNIIRDKPVILNDVEYLGPLIIKGNSKVIIDHNDLNTDKMDFKKVIIYNGCCISRFGKIIIAYK